MSQQTFSLSAEIRPFVDKLEAKKMAKVEEYNKLQTQLNNIRSEIFNLESSVDSIFKVDHFQVTGEDLIDQELEYAGNYSYKIKVKSDEQIDSISKGTDEA